MPVKRTIPFNTGIYFITFTCYRWINLIEKTNAYDLFYSWFDILKKNDHNVVGYVIMPNHVHLLISFSQTKQSINTIIGNGKRFIAYEIVKRLEEANEADLLALLQTGVEENRKANNKRHEVWQQSFDWKYCDSEKLILQKLNYLHYNPCNGKWMLAPDFVGYIHSSAGFYELNSCVFKGLVHYKEITG
jgi:REP element-mobilizing transposase RayT